MPPVSLLDEDMSLRSLEVPKLPKRKMKRDFEKVRVETRNLLRKPSSLALRKRCKKATTKIIRRGKIKVEQSSLPFSPRKSELSQSLPATSIFSYFKEKKTKINLKHKTDKPIALKKTKSVKNLENIVKSVKIENVNAELKTTDRKKAANTRLYFDYDMFTPKFLRKVKNRKNTPLYLSNKALLYKIVLFPFCREWWLKRLSITQYQSISILYTLQILVTVLQLSKEEKSEIDIVEISCPLLLFSILICLLLYCMNMLPIKLKQTKKKKKKLENDVTLVVSETCQQLSPGPDSGDNADESNVDEVESLFSFQQNNKSEFNQVEKDASRLKLKKVTEHLSKEQITAILIDRVEKEVKPSLFTGFVKVVSFLTAAAPTITRIYNLEILTNLADIVTLQFPIDLLTMTVCAISTYIVSARILNELIVAERYLYRKYLFAKFFKKLSSKQKAKKAKLPYFSLDSPQKIHAWAMIRCQVSTAKLLFQESSSETVTFVANLTVVVWSIFILRGVVVDVDEYSFGVLFYNLPGALVFLWLGTFSVFCWQYDSLYVRYLHKMNSIIVLQDELINLSFQLSKKSRLTVTRKTELSSSLNLIQKLMNLLRGAEPAETKKTKAMAKILTPFIEQIFRILAFSCMSSFLIPMLGYNPRLHKIMKI